MTKVRFDKSLELYRRARAIIPGGSQTNSKRATAFAYGAYPIYVDHARGSHVWDIDGNEYVDWVMALGPITLGYCYDPIEEAVDRQKRRGVLYGLLSPLEVEVGEQLCEVIPCAEMVRFMKTGAEVTSAATRIARAFTRREIILSHGYHGWHDTWTATVNDGGVPHCMEALVRVFPYNDIAALETLFAKYRDQVAAVVMTPFGTEIPTEGYLQAVRELTHENNALLVFDEIVTGFRLALGGAQEYFHVTPDIACFAKGMANGYPVAAVTGRADVMSIAEDLVISTTYGGEALSLAATKAALEVYQSEDVFGHTWRVGRMLMEGLNAAAEQFGFEPMAFGLAPMSGMKLQHKEFEGDASDMWHFFLQECAASGVLLRRGGLSFVTYSHSEADVNKTVEAASKALEQLADALRKGDLKERLRTAE